MAEFGSFTKAARQLKQPKSRVSRSIARLEEELKTELIKRTTRSTSLTEAGKGLYNDTKVLLDQLEKKIDSAINDKGPLSGTLSISAPLDFGENILPELICQFSENYPLVEFKILLSDSYIDLVANDIDLALRIGHLKDSSLKQKKISESEFILVASKEYALRENIPRKWSEFKNHSLLSFYNENVQDPLSEIYQKYGLSPKIRVNSFPLLKRLSLESKGIGLLPDFLCKKDLDQGKLVRVLPQWSDHKAPIQVVFSPSKNLPAKTRAFIDFLTSKIDLYS